MRSTRQGPFAPNGGEGLTLQQVMEMMRALQGEMVMSRANQELIQADFVVSQAMNEELRRNLQTHKAEREGADQGPVMPPSEFPTPFSTEIVDAVMPTTLVGPKVTFTGMEDPEAHHAAFHTQMMLVRGSDAVRCNLFMSTLAGTTMEWFMSLSDRHVTSFPQLTKLFRAQYLENRALTPLLVSYDFFDVKQYQGESLKEFLHRFGLQVVRLNLTKEKMMVHAFRKGIMSKPFSESLIRMAYITAEEELSEKRSCVVPTRPRVAGRPQILWVHEATTEMKAPVKHQPYQRPNTRGCERDNTP